MRIPGINDPNWKNIIQNKASYSLESLATKVILGRMNLTCQNNSSPEVMQNCISELRSFFESNAHLQKVQNDIKTIFGEGVL